MPSAEDVAVKKTPGEFAPGSFGCSYVVGRGGVEPPTFRFSEVTSPLLTSAPRQTAAHKATG